MVFALFEFLYKAHKDSRRYKVPLGLAVKNKARFSVQGGAFKDPRLLYPNWHDAIRSKDSHQPPLFRKSHTQV
ncbi:hypothetical protein RvY_09587 [Ramazzottius varieornatus]|uniref:Uncharacterized protein n=1 Tax=Ramazzottius varieornatus TaxID=947166 RepID=A0A1D1VIY0_RAMVA|nr:hypothetical protein RvY_09587 [Ramazzottius varieornatus]